MPTTVMTVDRRWLSQQQTLRDREDARNRMRSGRRTRRRTPHAACGNCFREFHPGDTAVSKRGKRHAKHWCAACAVRLGVCGRREVAS